MLTNQPHQPGNYIAVKRFAAIVEGKVKEENAV
jgi:hypothetical protein